MNHLLSVSGNPSGSFFVFRHPHMQASSSVVHIALLLICAALLGPNLLVNAKACGRLGESCPSYYACSFDTYCEPSVNKCLARKPPGSSCKYDSDCAPAAEPSLLIQQASCFAVASGPSTISNICTVANLFRMGDACINKPGYANAGCFSGLTPNSKILTLPLHSLMIQLFFTVGADNVSCVCENRHNFTGVYDYRCATGTCDTSSFCYNWGSGSYCQWLNNGTSFPGVFTSECPCAANLACNGSHCVPLFSVPVGSPCSSYYACQVG